MFTILQEIVFTIKLLITKILHDFDKIGLQIIART